jgi:putative MATE family efflux protein
MSETVLKAREDITSGPIIKTIFSLAVPVVLGMMMQIILSVVNFFWVGRLGPTAQDAITSSMVLCWSVWSSITIVSIGLTALVSRNIGAKDTEKAAHYAHQGIWLAVFLSVVVSILGFIFTPMLIDFMGTGAETRQKAIPYLQIFFTSAIFFALFDSVSTIFRAAGNTKTPMMVSVMTIILNMILDPLLIFGIGPFPKLGVPGASLATMISVGIGCGTILYLLHKGKAGFSVTGLFRKKPIYSDMMRIVRIGVPITIQQLTFSVVYWFLIRIVHQYGDVAGAAMGIGNRMESISYLTCSGFGMAASAMVGQNLGAGKPDRAAKCAWGAAGIAVFITCIIGAVFIIVPQWITGIFTSDPAVHEIAADYLIILGLSQFTMAIEIVLEDSFSGAGDTIPVMVVLIPGAILRVPLAYYLCFNLGFGVNGVWWTMTITTVIKASVLALWFRRGKWKLKQV